MKTSFRKYLALFVALISIVATSCSENKTSNQKAVETDTLENLVADSNEQKEHSDSASKESNFGLNYKSEYWAENPRIYWQGSPRTYISDVLNSSSLKEGDTIFFPRGIYTERLALENKKGLYLMAKDGPAYFLIKSNTADVFTIRNCENVHLEGFYFKHDVPAGSCMDAIALKIENSKNISLEKCLMNGSGTVGLLVDNSTNVKANNCIIEECYHTGLQVSKSNAVTIENSVITSKTPIYHYETFSNAVPYQAEFQDSTKFNLKLTNNRIEYRGNYGRLIDDSYVTPKGNYYFHNNLIITWRERVKKVNENTNKYAENNGFEHPFLNNGDWHPGQTFMSADAKSILGTPIFSPNSQSVDLAKLWEENSTPSIKLLFPELYYKPLRDSSEIGKNFDTMHWHNAKKLVVYKNNVTFSTLKFEMTKAVDHLDFDLYQEAVLSAKDSCTFIIDEGEIEPGPLPALKWKPNGNSHAVFYNGKKYVIETTRTTFISFVNFRDQNGSRILAFQTEVQGEYDGYGQIDVIWVGDLNKDGTPDFVCNYYSSYCSYDHLMFLSDSTKPNGFEIIRYNDIATGPCGC